MDWPDLFQLINSLILILKGRKSSQNYHCFSLILTQCSFLIKIAHFSTPLHNHRINLTSYKSKYHLLKVQGLKIGLWVNNLSLCYAEIEFRVFFFTCLGKVKTMIIYAPNPYLQLILELVTSVILSEDPPKQNLQIPSVTYAYTSRYVLFYGKR